MHQEIRFTKEARNDLKQLYRFFINQGDIVANQALATVYKAIAILELSPFSTKKANSDNPFLREFLISFAGYGYTALIDIDESKIVTVLAVRNQREDDYY